MRAAITLSISVGLLAILGFAGLGGCSGDPLPTGVYKGKHQLDIRPGADPVVANQLARVVLTIHEDGKAALEDGGLPFEGQVSRRGADLNFEVLAVAGKNIERQPVEVPRHLKFSVRKDGGIDFGDVQLVRQP